MKNFSMRFENNTYQWEKKYQWEKWVRNVNDKDNEKIRRRKVDENWE